MFKFFAKKKQEEASPLTFSVVKNEEGEYVVQFTFTDQFREFLRNSDVDLDLANLSDEELAHTFLYQHCQDWLSDNAKKAFFTESHSFVDGRIKYDRVWNKPFITAVQAMDFEGVPQSEPEVAELYMNYVYGTRLMEELEAAAEANPVSIAHPQLSDPNNKFKG